MKIIRKHMAILLSLSMMLCMTPSFVFANGETPDGTKDHPYEIEYNEGLEADDGDDDGGDGEEDTRPRLESLSDIREYNSTAQDEGITWLLDKYDSAVDSLKDYKDVEEGLAVVDPEEIYKDDGSGNNEYERLQQEAIANIFHSFVDLSYPGDFQGFDYSDSINDDDGHYYNIELNVAIRNSDNKYLCEAIEDLDDGDDDEEDVETASNDEAVEPQRVFFWSDTPGAFDYFDNPEGYSLATLEDLTADELTRDVYCAIEIDTPDVVCDRLIVNGMGDTTYFLELLVDNINTEAFEWLDETYEARKEGWKYEDLRYLNIMAQKEGSIDEGQGMFDCTHPESFFSDDIFNERYKELVGDSEFRMEAYVPFGGMGDATWGEQRYSAYYFIGGDLYFIDDITSGNIRYDHKIYVDENDVEGDNLIELANARIAKYFEGTNCDVEITDEYVPEEYGNMFDEEKTYYTLVFKQNDEIKAEQVFEIIPTDNIEKYDDEAYASIVTDDSNSLEGTSKVALEAKSGIVPFDLYADISSRSEANKVALTVTPESNMKADATGENEIGYKMQVTASGVSVDGTELKSGDAFRVYDDNNKLVGTYAINDSGDAVFEVSHFSTYYIVPGNEKKTPVVVNAKTATYNGKTLKGTVAFKTQDGKTLYSKTVSGKNPGTYSVKFAGNDEYKGATGSFKIAVKSTSIKSLKKAKKAFTVKVKKQSKTYVSGYQVRYSLNSDMSKAKIKTIGTKYNKVSKKISKLKSKKKYYVQVRSYKKIGSKKYYSSWSTKKSVMTK